MKAEDNRSYRCFWGLGKAWKKTVENLWITMQHVKWKISLRTTLEFVPSVLRRWLMHDSNSVRPVHPYSIDGTGGNFRLDCGTRDFGHHSITMSLCYTIVYNNLFLREIFVFASSSTSNTNHDLLSSTATNSTSIVMWCAINSFRSRINVSVTYLWENHATVVWV